MEKYLIAQLTEMNLSLSNLVLVYFFFFISFNFSKLNLNPMYYLGRVIKGWDQGNNYLSLFQTKKKGTYIKVN